MKFINKNTKNSSSQVNKNQNELFKEVHINIIATWGNCAIIFVICLHNQTSRVFIIKAYCNITRIT